MFLKFRNIHKKTPVLESLFNKEHLSKQNTYNGCFWAWSFSKMEIAHIPIFTWSREPPKIISYVKTYKLNKSYIRHIRHKRYYEWHYKTLRVTTSGTTSQCEVMQDTKGGFKRHWESCHEILACTMALQERWGNARRDYCLILTE